MGKSNWSMKACGVILLWAAAAAALPAQTFTTLVNFDTATGAVPTDSLAQGLDGNLYGTTADFGANNGGTVFKVTPGGTLTTLYNFCSQPNCADGLKPVGGLVLGSDGNFYGTTYSGGSSNCEYGCGTVFKITPQGLLTTLYSFTGDSDGSAPYPTMIQGADGDFYGTASVGGGYDGGGTIFRITPAGSFKTLYRFKSVDGYDYPYGADPYGELLQARDGNFYGTTYTGGANSHGTVFQITPSGMFTLLYSFCEDGPPCIDGEYPYGGLVQGTDGDLYGTTFEGGTSTACDPYPACGTVFRITAGGTLTTLHSFEQSDGNAPGQLIQATDGNFYGMTTSGGETGGCTNIDIEGGCGTIYKITPGGTLTTLYIFGSGNPEDGLVQSTNGEFYGTTPYGGPYVCDEVNCGTAFSLNVGLGQFVETLPTSGKAGVTVKILGSFLTGATSVTFNGTPATFSVISKSEITTTVPTGATTGTVQVISPRLGTLSSNVPFTVRP
jgi:uncharacterized repeat protein (TIGR03803 family)